MRRFAFWLLCLAALGGAVFWWLTRPAGEDARFAALTGDADAGRLVYAATGCGSCHAEKGDGPPVLSGGYRIESPFGTFIAPNISPGPAGIGGWSLPAFARAVQQGVSPEGQHYYPAFPYAAYAKMAPQDVADLKAYIDTLPASDTPSPAHEIGFPFTIRRGLGLWKMLQTADWVLKDAPSPEMERGRYLVEAMGHCAECHTPRGLTGHLQRDQWMMGAPNPSGKGTIPAIHPSKLSWSDTDIAYYLETGFTPDYDSAGGAMASVIRNMSQLPAEDRAAIAAYLKALN